MSSTLLELASESPVSTCAFDYLKKSPLYEKEKPYYFSGPLESDAEKRRSNLAYTKKDGVQLRDLRGREQSLSLERHGFQVINHTPKVDLLDPDEAEMNAYLHDISQHVKEALGAELAVCYTYRFRKETPEEEKAKAAGNIGTHRNQDIPIFTPHTDQTVEGGPRRARRHLSEDEISRYLQGGYRLRLINCWRPLHHPAVDKPLAMCDYYSIKRDDLKAADRASREYVGEIYYMQYDAAQQWYWISDQKPDEVMLFTNYDSKPGKAPPFMVHSSFQNRNATGDFKPRQSLETGLIVISKE